jgi:adenosine deaminase
VLVTVNSDDPGMTSTDIGDDYVAVAEAFGWPLATMEDLSLDAIEASFAPDDEKAALRTRFLAEFDELRAEFGHPPRGAALRGGTT